MYDIVKGISKKYMFPALPLLLRADSFDALGSICLLKTVPHFIG